MKLRDPNTQKWLTKNSDIFEAGFLRISDVPHAWDILQWIDDCLQDDPRGHDGMQRIEDDRFSDDHEMWVWQSPSIEGMMLFRIVYEIVSAAREVILWHISMTEMPDYGDL